MSNPLQPLANLANALMAAAAPCMETEYVYLPSGQHLGECRCQGTGFIWPLPLEWLAGQVLERHRYYRHEWVAKDRPVGWDYGVARVWASRMWWLLRPKSPLWLDGLLSGLSDLIDSVETGELTPEQLGPAALAALVVAVDAVAKEAKNG